MRNYDSLTSGIFEKNVENHKLLQDFGHASKGHFAKRARAVAPSAHPHPPVCSSLVAEDSRSSASTITLCVYGSYETGQQLFIQAELLVSPTFRYTLHYVNRMQMMVAATLS